MEQLESRSLDEEELESRRSEEELEARTYICLQEEPITLQEELRNSVALDFEI